MIITHCTDEELAHVSNYCRNHFTGRGCIVEYGPMLGGSTQAMLDGLRDKKATIYSIDRFKYEEWMQLGMVGESFLYTFIKNINFDTRVCPIELDLEQGFNIYDYPLIVNGIEFMFIDAAKSFKSSFTIFKTFSSLIKGAYVFDQDFCHAIPVTFYQKVMYYLLRDYIVPIHKAGAGVGFMVLQAIPLELIINKWYSLFVYSNEEIVKCTLDYFVSYLKS